MTVIGVAPPGLDYPRGVEFWVQAQQLVHGGKDLRLRQRSTLWVYVEDKPSK
jgi:hypothetical protein